MKQLIPLSAVIREKAILAEQKLKESIKRNWFKALLIFAVAFSVFQKDLSIDLSFNSAIARTSSLSNMEKEAPSSPQKKLKAMNTSLVETTRNSNASSTSSKIVSEKANLKTPKANRSSKELSEKRKQQQAYVKRFSKVAENEMKKYGIPASITLAQGLLESNIGKSSLARKNNNHFGIKCFSRNCKKGHCSNHTDDSHKDFFRVYKSTWESYRAHSVLLQAPRYKSLKKLKRTDYKGWAKGLKKAGYATDPRYAEKLINLIEDLDLAQYDK